MPGNGDQPPTEQALRRLLDVVAPGTRPVGVHPLAASYSNHNHLIDVEGPDGHRDRLVTRRYADGGEPPARKAVREYRTLELLREHPEVPTPEPLLLDVDGMLLGSPGIVTRFVAGELVPAHPQSTRWAQLCVKAARVLANIHAVPIDLGRDEYLMDAATEAVWFLGDGPPDYMRAHPDGAAVWQAVGDLRHDLAPVPPTLVHVDFWSGNIVWDGDNVNAVVDWEEAGYGDPAIDVAYCLMELALEGKDAAAARFVDEYESRAGRTVANLAYWKLAAAARPMIDIDEWITQPPMAPRFRRFIDQALNEAGRLP